MSKDDKKLLANIIENAFDFLETAINEFKDKPKYSILHFNTAIELFLKARLIDEHWSLIIANEDPDKTKFENGDFQSITLSKSIKKIRNIIGDEIPKEYEDAFAKIAKHRNKLVHFFHADLKDEPLPAAHIIASEQCIGWYYLKILLKKWQNTFSNHQKYIQRLDDLMKKHRSYLSIVFDNIKDNIKHEKSQGVAFKNCPSCGFESSKEHEITENVKELKCLVCPFIGEIISIPCPECERFLEIEQGDNDPHECLNCGHQLRKEDLKNILDTDITTPDSYMDQGAINCTNCWTDGSVIAHHDLFICTNCYTISKNSDQCDWCNERQIPGGKLEDSFLYGCEFCDGRLGHMKDD